MTPCTRVVAVLMAVAACAWSQTPEAPDSRPGAESRPSRGGGQRRAAPIMSTLVGKIAPDFDLARADAKGRVKLSTYKNDRPVLLVFGSWT